MTSKHVHAKDGSWSVYCQDSTEWMPAADLIVTDPPYLLTSGGKNTGEMGGCLANDIYNNSGGLIDCQIDWKDFMPLLFKSLKDPGHAYIMANNRNVQPMLNAADEAGFHFHNLLVWDKVSATPNRWYMKNLEFTGFFSKGKAFYINDCSQKQLIRCPQVDESKDENGKPHPTEKPVSLMACYIINSTHEGQTVLDPFMGSGTTGVAAVQYGRKFIGIEKDERFFDMAVERLSKALDQRNFAI